MAVKIGSARISENNTAGWDGKAKAGDQTGKEVSTQDWYLHTKGWVVLRPKKAEVAEKIAWDMQAACDNAHIGYDQSQRDTLWNIVKSLGFDCSKVTTNCETDCSALVRVCVNYAGVSVGNFRTANEVDVLMATDAFTKLTDAKYTKSSDLLKRGDVLVTTESGHTVVVLTNGAKVDVAPEPEPTKTVKAKQAAQHRNTNLSGKYEVTASNLNMRDGAGTGYKVLVVLPKGTVVRCYGWYNNYALRKWLYVTLIYKGVEYVGYCSSKYLKKKG